MAPRAAGSMRLFSRARRAMCSCRVCDWRHGPRPRVVFAAGLCRCRFMAEILRIGNAQAFWGDDSAAAARLATQAPNLDWLTLDYLAEVSMSILAKQREREPSA